MPAGGMGNAVQREMGMADPLPEAAAKEERRKPRRRRRLIAIAAVLIVGIAVAVVSFRPTHNQIAGPPLLKADARELKSTVVTRHLEEQIVPGRNVLWCSTFQLAWNEGCRGAGGDIRLDVEPPMVPILNKKTARQTDLAPDSYVAMFGRFDAGIVGKIRQELEHKFQGQASPDLLNTIEREVTTNGMQGACLAYAYLFRNLTFEYRFERLKKPLAFGSTKVASFGLTSDTPDWPRLAEQVSVLDYRSDDDFILALRPNEKGERILLAKIVPAETIEKTISSILKRVTGSSAKDEPSGLSRNEPLMLPILDFEVLREYVELEGKHITTPGPLQGMPIFRALQSIRFRLDARGAVLESEAAETAAFAGTPNPRQFIFDKPFLILLERTDAAQPYFALWVDNAELLAPYN